MKFSSYVGSGIVITDIEGSTKEEIIKNIIEKASHQEQELSKLKNTIISAVLQRENELSTVMNTGIMIPHARLDEFNEFEFIIANLKNGINLETPLGKSVEVKTVFLIISGKQKNKLMLKIVSAIVKLSQNKEIAEKIKKARDKQEIISLIEDSHIELESYILAKHLMQNSVIPVKMTDKLEDVTKRFVIENRPAFPVVDGDGNFCGDICEVDILKAGIPAYAEFLDDMSFMKDDEMLEEYMKKEKEFMIKEFYNKNVLTVDEEASLVGITFMMTSKRNPRVYVVTNGKYIGEIYSKDIIKKEYYI